MFTYNEAIVKLNSSHWPETAKQSLLPVLPRLGKWSLSFISQQLNSTGSEFVANDIVKIISLQPVWYENLQKSQAQEIKDTINQIISEDQEHQRKALLAVILDIRTNKTINAQVNAGLSRIFDQIEVMYLTNLPLFEVTAILNKRIYSILDEFDLELEIMRYCYYRDSLEKENPEIIGFRRALESNEQALGKESNTIKFWINDFLQSINSTDRSAYSVARYITNNPSVKNLDNKEKSDLSGILELYNWFFQPYIAEDEIESYEAIRLGQPDEALQSPSESDIIPVQISDFDSVRSTPSANINTPKASPPVPQPTPTPRPTPPKSPVHLAAPTNFDDIVSQLPKQKMGVVMDPTNIKISEEKQRLESEKNAQANHIQQKLADLRNRNKKQS